MQPPVDSVARVRLAHISRQLDAIHGGAQLSNPHRRCSDRLAETAPLRIRILLLELLGCGLRLVLQHKTMQGWYPIEDKLDHFGIHELNSKKVALPA